MRRAADARPRLSAQAKQEARSPADHGAGERSRSPILRAGPGAREDHPRRSPSPSGGPPGRVQFEENAERFRFNPGSPANALRREAEDQGHMARSPLRDRGKKGKKGGKDKGKGKLVLRPGPTHFWNSRQAKRGKGKGKGGLGGGGGAR